MVGLRGLRNVNAPANRRNAIRLQKEPAARLS